MSFRILRASVMVEQNDDFHEARLLLLLHHASTRGDGSIKGITKLAKLDFFLRYPAFLRRLVAHRACESKWKREQMVPGEAFEENTVESKMIRFKYGPWDHRYREWLGLLNARGLICTYVLGRTVNVQLTEKGKEVAANIAQCPEFSVLNARSELVWTVAGALSASRVKDLVYQLVPEITGMTWGEEIDQ